MVTNLYHRCLVATLWLALVLSSCQSAVVPVTQETKAVTSTATLSPTATPSPTPEPIKDIQMVGQIGGSTYAIALQGSYAYLGMGPRAIVLDITNPNAPVFIGQTAILPDTVRDIAIEKNYAYVAAGDSGLRIYLVKITTHDFADRLLLQTMVDGLVDQDQHVRGTS